MADAKKKTFEDFVGVPRHGPDPVDDAKVTEFTQRSQDPRAAPWEALRRGGARLDSALGTGPGSQRSALDQGVQNLGRYLNQPVPGQPWPGPEVGPTRDVGDFESLAQKIPDALTSPMFQAMAFPTGEESLARMRDEAVFRDQMESKGAAPVAPAPGQALSPDPRSNPASLVARNPEASALWDKMQAWRQRNPGRARTQLDSPKLRSQYDSLIEDDINRQQQAQINNENLGGGGGPENWHTGEGAGAQPTGWARELRLELDNEEPTAGAGSMADERVPIPAPSSHPERPTLETFLSKLYGRR